MAEQRQIYVRIWDDPDFEEYPPDGKLIFIHLITNKHVTASGVYPYTFKKIHDKTGIEKAEVMKLINGPLSRCVHYDHKYHLIWVKNRLKYNPSGNPCVMIRSILNDYRKLRRSEIWDEYWEYNRKRLEKMIDKSEKLKTEISTYQVIMPDKLVESSLKVRQWLGNHWN
jgi:hypothetical protein